MTHKLCWTTDIHLDHLTEFLPLKVGQPNVSRQRTLSKSQVEAFCTKIRAHKPDSVVITGDISTAEHIEQHLDHLGQCLDGIPVRFVLGNHDYYNGSITEVRKRIWKGFQSTQGVGWLNALGVVELTPDTALVGHDGWYDGVYSDWFKSKLMMNEYFLTTEFRFQPPALLHAKLRELANECAIHIRKHVREAAKKYKTVIFATHVPPFRENSRAPDFQLSDVDWLPNMSSGLAGEALLDVAREFPGVEFLCLSGHTHTPWKEQYQPNLHCWTGKAVYGKPESSIELIEVG
jgi:Icc protein